MAGFDPAISSRSDHAGFAEPADPVLVVPKHLSENGLGVLT